MGTQTPQGTETKTTLHGRSLPLLPRCFSSITTLQLLLRGHFQRIFCDFQPALSRGEELLPERQEAGGESLVPSL